MPTPDSLEEKNTQRRQADALWKAVQSLRVSDQQIVYLRYFLELSVAETADALQIAEGTVKSRMSRALKKLEILFRMIFPLS